MTTAEDDARARYDDELAQIEEARMRVWDRLPGPRASRFCDVCFREFDVLDGGVCVECRSFDPEPESGF